MKLPQLAISGWMRLLVVAITVPVLSGLAVYVLVAPNPNPLLLLPALGLTTLLLFTRNSQPLSAQSYVNQIIGNEQIRAQNSLNPEHAKQQLVLLKAELARQQLLLDAQAGAGGMSGELAERRQTLVLAERFCEKLADAASVDSLNAIASVRWPELPETMPELFPSGLREAVAALAQIGDTADRAMEITSPVNLADTMAEVNEQLVLLTRAQYELKDLREGFGPPLGTVVNLWAHVIKDEGERMREARKQGPVPNPYVYGNPVRGLLFVGREDVLRRLEELWGSKGQCPSVVLYGHRRMGKSSVLQNLGGLHMPQRSIVVDFNLQRIGRVRSTGELLHGLALKLFDEASAAGLTIGRLDEPGEAEFLGPERNPYMAFDRFLGRLGRARSGHRFVVAVDEFELFEEQIVEGRLEPHLLAAFRATFQTYPWFIMIFAGLHRLEELRQDYWNPLFASVTAIEVGFLSERAARVLITSPSPDFAIDYDSDAIARILSLTHGQPYLIQLICHSLVARYNRQVVEDPTPPQRRFILADVEAVVAQQELFRDGLLYFQGVWDHAERSEPPGQAALLRALAAYPGGLSLAQLVAGSGLSTDRVASALKTLIRHAVVEERPPSADEEAGAQAAAAAPRYGFAVELMRRWVASL